MSTADLRQRHTAAPGQAEKDELVRQAEIREAENPTPKEEVDPNMPEKFIPPTFTVKQLLDCIPAHCFHRSAVKSMQYVIQDLTAIGLLAWASFQVDPTLAKLNIANPYVYTILRASIYTVISIATGLFGTGIWILGHECGHQAFSSSKTINNSVGWVLHSLLFVPYHAWRISHGKHHAATGHLTRDEVFVPRTRSQLGLPEIKEEGELEGYNISQQRQEELREAVSDAPLVILFWLVCQQLFGFPMYLIRNASGQKRLPYWTNHFLHNSAIFKPHQAMQIYWSDIGLLLWASVLAVWGHYRGSREVIVMFVIPYLQVNHWLVSITYLQHTDPLLPHYSANKWTFARGALCTMDRDFFGPIGKYVLHGICETHVAHHTSSKIPHYNAWAATEAIKNYVGEYYMKSDESFLYSLFKNYGSCRWVEDSGDVVFYKNSRGLAKRVPAEETGGVSDSGVDMSADVVEKK